MLCFGWCQWVLNCCLAVTFNCCCDVYLKRSVRALALLACRVGVAPKYYEISPENKYPGSGFEMGRGELAPEDATIAPPPPLLSLAFIEAWP